MQFGAKIQCTDILRRKENALETTAVFLKVQMRENKIFEYLINHVRTHSVKRFRSGIKIARTRTFPGADVGSDHDMVMMTFQIRLKNSRKTNPAKNQV